MFINLGSPKEGICLCLAHLAMGGQMRANCWSIRLSKRGRYGCKEQVEAVAYDNPIPGYNTSNTINLRLWAAKPSGEFDLVCLSLVPGDVCRRVPIGI